MMRYDGDAVRRRCGTTAMRYDDMDMPMNPTAESPAPPRGLFIVFEGGEATGKTTQARLLADSIGAMLTHEPGGTSLGKAIRTLCLGDGHNPEPVAELLLMAADRAQHIAEVIEPALAAGQDVVCDRFTYSTVAYQGAGRGLDPELIRMVTQIAAQGLEPDVVIVIHVDPAIAASRLAARGGSDRLERAGDAFHQRVVQSFLDQAEADEYGIVVSGNGDIDAVEEAVLAGLQGLIAGSIGGQRT